MDNKEKYINIFKDLFNVEETKLNDKFTFAAVDNWDSLTHMSLISMLEDEFDVFFDTEDILNFGSFNNGINILRKYGVEI